MIRLLLFAILMQGSTSQQMGVVIGHVTRGPTPSSAGIPVIARTEEGVLVVPDPNFSFVYQVGHGSLDHLTAIDTVRGTFTKDMVTDPSRTFQFRFTDAQLSEIEKKLDAIDFWNSTKYPSLFTMPNPGPTGCMTSSRQPMFLLVKRGQVVKELTWMDQDTLCTPNDAGRDLRSLKELIRQMIASTPVSPTPPTPRGMYID